MKVAPLAPSAAGYPGKSLTIGQPAREAQDNAIAVAEGQDPMRGQSQDPQAARMLNSRKLKMRTRTPSAERAEAPVAAPEGLAQAVEGQLATPPEGVPAANPEAQPTEVQAATDAAPEAPGGATTDPSEQAKETSEETKPLSPQFAALARQRRALQVKEREIQDRERALAAKASSPDAESVITRLKSDPLSVLQEHGVTYDQLTEALLASQSGITPEITNLKQELKALKEELKKDLTDRDSQAEQAALSEIRREAQRLAAQGDEFELVSSTNSVQDVVDLIHRTYKETGEVLDTSEAMALVENELLEESLKLAAAKKVQAKLKPATPPVQPSVPSQQLQPKPMKTLTSRDSAPQPMSRRDRAIAAMTGLKK